MPIFDTWAILSILFGLFKTHRLQLTHGNPLSQRESMCFGRVTSARTLNRLLVFNVFTSLNGLICLHSVLDKAGS